MVTWYIYKNLTLLSNFHYINKLSGDRSVSMSNSLHFYVFVFESFFTKIYIYICILYFKIIFTSMQLYKYKVYNKFMY